MGQGRGPPGDVAVLADRRLERAGFDVPRSSRPAPSPRISVGRRGRMPMANSGAFRFLWNSLDKVFRSFRHRSETTGGAPSALASLPAPVDSDVQSSRCLGDSARKGAGQSDVASSSIPAGSGGGESDGSFQAFHTRIPPPSTSTTREAWKGWVLPPALPCLSGFPSCTVGHPSVPPVLLPPLFLTLPLDDGRHHLHVSPRQSVRRTPFPGGG